MTVDPYALVKFVLEMVTLPNLGRQLERPHLVKSLHWMMVAQTFGCSWLVVVIEGCSLMTVKRSLRDLAHCEKCPLLILLLMVRWIARCLVVGWLPHLAPLMFPLTFLVIAEHPTLSLRWMRHPPDSFYKRRIQTLCLVSA